MFLTALSPTVATESQRDTDPLPGRDQLVRRGCFADAAGGAGGANTTRHLIEKQAALSGDTDTGPPVLLEKGRNWHAGPSHLRLWWSPLSARSRLAGRRA